MDKYRETHAAIERLTAAVKKKNPDYYAHFMLGYLQETIASMIGWGTTGEETIKRINEQAAKEEGVTNG